MLSNEEKMSRALISGSAVSDPIGIVGAMQRADRPTLYRCDPSTYKQCRKGICGTRCNATVHAEYAEKDASGKPLVYESDTTPVREA